jgi:hypothetical protein
VCDAVEAELVRRGWDLDAPAAKAAPSGGA